MKNWATCKVCRSSSSFHVRRMKWREESMCWKILNEKQYLQLRILNQPKIFIWLPPSFNQNDRKKLNQIISSIHREYYPSNKIIISLVEVNRDPMLQQLLSRINPLEGGPLVTGYLPNGATYFKSHEISVKILENLIQELVMISHN